MYLAAITGGLDLKLAIWDFSKGRPHNVIDYGKRKEFTFWYYESMGICTLINLPLKFSGGA